MNRIKKTPQIIKAHFELNLNAWCFATQRHGLDNNFTSFLSESWHCPIDRGWEYGFKHFQVLSNPVSSMTILSFYIAKTIFFPSFLDIDQMTLRWDQNNPHGINNIISRVTVLNFSTLNIQSANTCNCITIMIFTSNFHIVQMCMGLHSVYSMPTVLWGIWLVLSTVLGKSLNKKSMAFTHHNLHLHLCQCPYTRQLFISNSTNSNFVFQYENKISNGY